jgi:hypothetical protein
MSDSNNTKENALDADSKMILWVLVIFLAALVAVILLIIYGSQNNYMPLDHCTYKGLDAGRTLYDCWKEAK